MSSLKISKEYFHHHAYEILETHSMIKQSISDCFTSEISIVSRVKNKKGKLSNAIKADDFNKELRILLKNRNNDIRFEVNEENGVFYFSSEKAAIGGFDFGFINHKKNLLKLRNLCFGELQYFDGLKRWNKFLSKNPELKSLSDNLLDEKNIGQDIKYITDKLDIPLIVGEIQFGNWALAYRDFFKVLKANVQNSIDCLVYVVPTGNLESMLSDGIVTYDKSIKILEEFSKVISVPIWLVGIDLE